MLHNLHLFRAIAALGVVYFHTTSTAGLNLAWGVGSRGVDLFFVISGFIITYVGLGRPEQFFRRRLIRIVPFYWAATLAVFALVLIVPQYFRSTTGDVRHLLASLLFIPREAPTGEMQPTLILGWSLNFEMFFYVLFAIALAASRRSAALLCAGSLVLFVAIARAVGVQQPVAAFYARPIVLEFGFGIAAFYVFRWAAARQPALARVPPLKWTLVAVLLAGLILLPLLEKAWSDAPRYVAGGLPAFAVVTSGLLLERIFGLASRNPVVFLLGEASYIIYLIHPYIVFPVLRLLVSDAGSWGGASLALLVVGQLALVSAVAVSIHVWFERPVLAYLRRRFT